MKRAMSFVCVLALCLCFAGCGAGEETTLTGMVVSVEGTTVSLASFGAGDGEKPSMSEGQEGFASFGDGEMPSVPEGEVPSMPEGEMPSMPDGETPPERPEGAEGEQPEAGEGERPQGGDREFAGETTQVDLANAKITVEFDGGKATGTMDDITQGVLLTVTLNSKGEAVTAVVTEMTGFGQRGQKK